jgi:hypothetical protein
MQKTVVLPVKEPLFVERLNTKEYQNFNGNTRIEK